MFRPVLMAPVSKRFRRRSGSAPLHGLHAGLDLAPLVLLHERHELEEIDLAGDAHLLQVRLDELGHLGASPEAGTLSLKRNGTRTPSK